MAKPADARQEQREEIARRYKRKKRRPDLSALRLRELNLLLTARHGGEELPDTPDVRRALGVVAHHLANLPSNPRHTITAWLSLRAPWFSLGDTNALLGEVAAKPKRWRAHSLGWLLKLSAADRRALHITTIGPYDISPEDRASLRKQSARARAALHRRAKGSTSRSAYLAAVAKPKPWVAAGVSRASWYRSLKRSALLSH